MERHMTAATAPRITLNSPLASSQLPVTEWVGEIVADEMQPKKAEFVREGDSGYQWKYGIKPLNGFVKGKTGALWDYVDIPNEARENSKFGVVKEAFREVFTEYDADGNAIDLPLADGALVGKFAVFVQKKHEYGTNKRTGQKMEGDVLIPTRLATDEELKEFGVLGEHESTTFEWSPERVEVALSVLDGETTTSAKRAIFSSGIEDQALAQRLSDGSGVQFLIDGGHLTLDGKTYKRA